MKIRKIPLLAFIELLENIYEEGANYIDLSGIEATEEQMLQDKVIINVQPEYFTEDIEESDIFSENDFNNLIV